MSQLSPRDLIESELVVEQARAAARSGKLAHAAELLAHAATPNALDLRARVAAQRGRYDAADADWSAVQQQDPEHAGAAAGRAELDAIKAGQSRGRPVMHAGARRAALGPLLLAIAVAAVTWIVLAAEPVPPVVTGPPVVTAPPVGSPALGSAGPATSGPAVSPGPAGEGSTADRQPVARAQRLDVVATAVSGVPGALVQRRPDDVAVTFAEPLFDTDSFTLRAPALRVLREFRARLTAFDGQIAVVGRTAAVPGGRPGGSPLALARAQAVAVTLADGNGPPLTRFTLSAGDPADPALTGPEARTATLLLVPGP